MPRSLTGPTDIATALRRVGELLAATGDQYAIVIVGGAALNLLGVADRTTRDVDILAFARRSGRAWRLARPPEPLPEALVAAIRTVGRDMGLADDWLNTGPALQWKPGLPRGLGGRVKWRNFPGLRVGIIGKPDLVRLKLFAAADEHPGGRHVTDLVALDPTDAELRAAARWVKTQDAGPHFSAFVDQVVAHIRVQRQRGGRGGDG